MSAHKNADHPGNKIDRTTSNNLLAIITMLLVLITVAAITIVLTVQPTVITGSILDVPYSNAMEMLYAQPFINSQNNSVAAYGNALEMQYAQPWIHETDMYIAVTGVGEPSFACHSNLETLHACNAKYGHP